MILTIETGRDTRALFIYLSAGAGRDAPLFTNMAGKTPNELTREVAALRSLRPKLGKATAHLILSHDPSQRELTEDEWRKALEIALAEHRATGVPYAAYMHFEGAGPHLHCFFLRIDAKGNAISDSNSFRTNERAARAIEAAFGLGAPTPRDPKDRYPRAGGVRAERGRRRFERLNSSMTTPDQQPQRRPPRVIDPSLIFSAVDEADDLDDLCARLAARGIVCEFVQAAGVNEPTGWRLRQAGPAGTWMKGSDVSRALSLKKVKERIDERRRQRQVAITNDSSDELLDSIDKAARSRLAKDEEAAKLDEETRVEIAERQRDLGRLLLEVNAVTVRAAIVKITNAFASLFERRFGLTHGLLLGQMEMRRTTATASVPPLEPHSPGADLSEINHRIAAQQDMIGVLRDVCQAIEKNDPNLLPGLAVKDDDVLAARGDVFKAIEMVEAAQESEKLQHERERPQ